MWIRDEDGGSKRNTMGAEWHIWLCMWLGGEREEEGEDPSPYYIEDGGPSQEC